MIATAYVTTAKAGPLLMGAEFDEYYEYIATEVLSADDEIREQYRQLRTGDLDQFRAMGFPLGRIARFLGSPMIRFDDLSVLGLLDPRLRTMIGAAWTMHRPAAAGDLA